MRHGRLKAPVGEYFEGTGLVPQLVGPLLSGTALGGERIEVEVGVRAGEDVEGAAGGYLEDRGDRDSREDSRDEACAADADRVVEAELRTCLLSRLADAEPGHKYLGLHNFPL